MESCKVDKNSIQSELIDIVYNMFNLKIDESLIKESLVGKNMKLYARDLVYLYFKVKEVWNINIPQEDIAYGKFISIDSISNIVYEQLKENNRL